MMVFIARAELEGGLAGEESPALIEERTGATGLLWMPKKARLFGGGLWRGTGEV